MARLPPPMPSEERLKDPRIREMYRAELQQCMIHNRNGTKFALWALVPPMIVVVVVISLL